MPAHDLLTWAEFPGQEAALRQWSEACQDCHKQEDPSLRKCLCAVTETLRELGEIFKIFVSLRLQMMPNNH